MNYRVIETVHTEFRSKITFSHYPKDPEPMIVQPNIVIEYIPARPNIICGIEVDIAIPLVPNLQEY